MTQANQNDDNSKELKKWDTVAYRDTKNMNKSIIVVIVDLKTGEQKDIGKIAWNSSTVLFSEKKEVTDIGCGNRDHKHFVPVRQVSVGDINQYDPGRFGDAVDTSFRLLIDSYFDSPVWYENMDSKEIDRIIEEFRNGLKLFVEGSIGDDADTLDNL